MKTESVQTVSTKTESVETVLKITESVEIQQIRLKRFSLYQKFSFANFNPKSFQNLFLILSIHKEISARVYEREGKKAKQFHIKMAWKMGKIPGLFLHIFIAKAFE